MRFTPHAFQEMIMRKLAKFKAFMFAFFGADGRKWFYEVDEVCHYPGNPFTTFWHTVRNLACNQEGFDPAGEITDGDYITFVSDLRWDAFSLLAFDLMWMHQVRGMKDTTPLTEEQALQVMRGLYAKWVEKGFIDHDLRSVANYHYDPNR